MLLVVVDEDRQKSLERNDPQDPELQMRFHHQMHLHHQSSSLLPLKIAYQRCLQQRNAGTSIKT